LFIYKYGDDEVDKSRNVIAKDAENFCGTIQHVAILLPENEIWHEVIFVFISNLKIKHCIYR
jgi:hypothetical protein